MSSTQSPLTTSYTDDRVAVDPKWILEVMRVPNLGFDGDLYRDERPGAAAVDLFTEATSAGALVIPGALIVDCYALDTFYFNGFMLVADRRATFARVSHAAGVMYWRSLVRVVTSVTTTIPRWSKRRRSSLLRTSTLH